ncbi:hypothetical protein OD350_12450 [Clostridium beijerinckii]|nr:hypothetical protein [Clostridium beijerinckii]NRT35810.1 hypothetical protein [Clostridium beijerinckii]NRT44764.1 hypothetical protein [Clostridium beijerinckii]NRZ21244.1 hypothetical protein [Clostridium beijerinckii]UYZ38440.1 hypothetical protein OD350_12450 [Clostridium beijerinckii]
MVPVERRRQEAHFAGISRCPVNAQSKILKAMNSYGFFVLLKFIKIMVHLNKSYDENQEAQIIELGNALKNLWLLNFKDRFSDKEINVEVFKADDAALFIIVYEALTTD